MLWDASDLDSSPMGGYAWCIAKGPPQWTGSSYQPGGIYYKRIQWSGNAASWADSSWQQPSVFNPTRYYDFDSGQPYAPQAGSTNKAEVGEGRLTMAVIKNNFL